MLETFKLIFSAWDPFNFDADPHPNPGFALKKWIRIRAISLNLLHFLTKQNFQILSNFIRLFLWKILMKHSEIF